MGGIVRRAMLKSLAGGDLFGQTYRQPPYRIVALHGWERTSADWDGVLSPLDAGAVAVDLPGFGATPAPPEPWSPRRYAEAVAVMLRDRAVVSERPVVAGHSFGGRVAVWLAADYPELVGALVLTGVPFCRPPGERPPSPHWAFRVGRALHRAGLVSDARMERLRRKYGSADYARASGVMRAVNVMAVRETNEAAYDAPLSRIACPVALVWGAQDTAAPLEVAQAAAGLLADGELTVLPGVDHMTPLAAAGALEAALRRFTA